MSSKKTKGQKKSSAGPADPSELVFVLDVSSFTKGGFLGTSTYEGNVVELEFDDLGEGVFLTPEMALRLGVKKGSRVSVALEEAGVSASELAVSGTAKRPRISDPKLYYAIGREGGAVVRLRAA